MARKAKTAYVPLPPPSDTAYLWGWFGDLDVARQCGMNGAQSTPYQEIESWARLMRIRLAPWEVECLRMLDVLCLNSEADGEVPAAEVDDEPDHGKVAKSLFGFLRGKAKEGGSAKGGRGR